MANARTPNPARFSASGAVLCVAALAYFGGLARYGYHRAEDGDILQLIYRTAHGQQPYIDFASGYTPLFFHWHAALLRLFGENLMAIRWSLVVANSLTGWGLYTLGRTAMPAIFAVVAPLAYAAIIPAVPGEFCAFNIPYPAWYTTLFAVAAALAMVRWARNGLPGAAAAAGIAAGLAFSFKPNAGLFSLVGAALVLVCLVAVPQGRLGKWLWWALTLGAIVGLVGVFGARTIDREARLFLWPIVALVGIRAAYRQVAAPDSAQRDARFVASCLALGLGFASVTVPWLAYFFARLGWYRFIHEVLFIGSGYEQFFFLAFHPATKWDAAVGLGVIAFVAAGWFVRKGRLSPAFPLAIIGVGALACVVYVGLLAPMPEGFQRSVVSRVRDLSYGLCLLAHWGGVVLAGRGYAAAAARQRQLSPGEVAVITILAPALTMFLGLYPRSDFMHLTISVAASLVLGALLLSRMAIVWSRALGRQMASALRVGFVLPALLVIAVLFTPTARLWLALRGVGGVPFTSLDLSRAPIVLEAGRQQRLAALRATVHFLDGATTPRDSIFPFPDLNLVNVLAGRENPARVGYFQPGWPGHAVEAEAVQALRDKRPAYVVVLQAHELVVTAVPGYYFLTAPAYYFMFHNFISVHYAEAARFGPYVILRRHDLSAPFHPADSAAPASAPIGSDGAGAGSGSLRFIETLTAWGVEQVPGDLIALAGSGDPAVQEALAGLVRSSGDAAGAGRCGAGRCGGPAMAGELADTRALPALLRLVDQIPTDNSARDVLHAIASKAVIEQFWFVPPAETGQELGGLDSPALRERLLTWLGDDQDSRLRFFAAWATGVLREPRALPGLSRMLGESMAELTGVAAQALSAIAPSQETLALLVDEVGKEKTFLPAIIIGMYTHDRAAGAAVMRQQMHDADGERLELLCWIAGTVGDPALAGGALKGLTDAAPDTRLAAAWALGELGTVEVRPALESAGADPDRRVRAFVAMALARVAHRDTLPET